MATKQARGPRARKPAAKKAVAAKKPAAKRAAAKRPAARKPAAKKAAAAKPPAAKQAAAARPPAAKKPAAATKPPPAKPLAAKPTAAKKPPPAKPPAAAAAGDALYAPARFQILDNGMSQIFFDIDDLTRDDLDVEGAFATVDLEGNGYEWEAVLAPALARAHPAAFAAIEWSPEADAFVAIASDPGPLAALAAVLRDVIRTQASLAAAVARHDPDRT